MRHNLLAMVQGSPSGKAPTDERRRFLQESVRGAFPLLVDWMVNRGRDIARLAHSRVASTRTSTPPQAKEEAPADAKEKLDSHYREFARDNPDSDPSST